MKSVEAKKQRKEMLNKFIQNNSFEHQRWEDLDGRYLPKIISPIRIEYIETAEPGEPDIYKNKQSWYSIREMIDDLAEQAYFSYYIGAYYASFLSSIMCIESILKYEYKRKNKTIKLDFSLGSFTGNDDQCKKRLEKTGLAKFYKDLNLLNDARNGLIHFNKDKLKKATIKINTRIGKTGVPFLIGVIQHVPVKRSGYIEAKTGYKYHKENYRVPTDNRTEISKFAYFAFQLNRKIITKLYGKRK